MASNLIYSNFKSNVSIISSNITVFTISIKSQNINNIMHLKWGGETIYKIVSFRNDFYSVTNQFAGEEKERKNERGEGK